MNGQFHRSAVSVLRSTSTAIVGASDRSPWAKVVYSNLRRFGFPGKIHLINPKHSKVWDSPCYPDFASLPNLPDHALIIIPAPVVVSVLEEASRTGVKAATVYSANLGDGATAESIARGIALKALCADTGLVVSGPNCMGSMSFREKYFVYRNFPDSEMCALQAGSVGGVFQSGGTLQVWANSAADRGIRFSYLISSGNELNLDLADYLDFLIDDEHTKTIVLFIEGIRRPEAFMAAAARALKAGKPIVAIKTGKSSLARETAQSHSGAISGDYDVFTALCERYGIILCKTLDDIVEVVLALQPGRLPKGPRVGVFTTSGGTVDMLHDYVEDVGTLSMPDFGASTMEKIRALVPPEIVIRNPIDAGDPAGDKNAAAICRAIAADPNVDMLAWAGQLPVGQHSRDPAVLRDVFDSTDKPVVCFSRLHHGVDTQSVTFQEKAGIPFLHDIGSAFRALSALAFYGERSGRLIPSLREPTGARADLAGAKFEARLKASGLPPPASAMVERPEQAGRAALDIGFPVALKIIAPQFSHKTEIGGVRLNLLSPEEVEREAAALALTLKGIDPLAQIDGFLVQAMVSGPELLLGARTDPLYGPMLVLGAGGTLVELLGDKAFRLLPVGRDYAEAMVQEVNVTKSFGGYRNMPRRDINALIEAICGLSDLYLDIRHIVSDIEINPLMVLPEGQGVRAVDVRVIFHEPSQSTS